MDPDGTVHAAGEPGEIWVRGEQVPGEYLGRDGGFCRGLADVELLVPQEVTARIQEAHKVIIHLLCELVEPDLAKQ